MSYPESVRIVEVGPRDGLQNEPRTVAVADRVTLIEMLADAGLSAIECGSFVSPRWVPQMAGSAEVFAGIRRKTGVSYRALVPNTRGYEEAHAAPLDEIAVFAAASERFSQRNLNCSIDESFTRFEPILRSAAADGLPVRGYLSCVLGCPYDGPIDPVVVSTLTRRLLAVGCYEVSLGDTIGVGTPGSLQILLDQLTTDRVPFEALAVHFHDTYGQALANILLSLQHGIAVIDSAVAGLGGCPYAPGASGNVASEDLVYMLNGLGIAHGVSLERLIDAGRFITERLATDNRSRAAKALAQRLSGGGIE